MLINQKKAGVLLTYFNTALNMCVTLLFTPFLISQLGESEYGVYKIMSSFASQLAIINFGIGSLVMRYIAKYNALEEKKEKENFLFMALMISAIISLAVGAVGFSLQFAIDTMFADSLTVTEIVLAKKLYLILVATTVVSVFRDFFSGIVRGHERFAFSVGISTVRIIVRVSVIAVLILCGFSSVSIVATDFAIAVSILLFEMIYSFGLLKEKIKFHYWDKKEFLLCMSFAGALVLQSIVNQVNQNLDSVILGAAIKENTMAIVTLYSFALVIYTTYGNLTGAFSNVFVPKVTKMIFKDATPEQLTDIVIRVGRYQMMISGAIIFGFVLLGKNFLTLWVGEQYVNAYYPTLILIIPATIPLVESVAVSILDAKMKRMVRSVVLVVMVVFNIAFSLIFIKFFGYIGAAMGTAVSMIIGHGLIMNWYYSKKIGLNIKRLFFEVCKGILPCAVITSLICFLPAKYLPCGYIGFVIKGIIFVAVYCSLLYFFAMNKDEKSQTVDVFKRFIKKLKIRRNGHEN